MVFEYNNEFMPHVDRFANKWHKVCSNCKIIKASKAVVIAMYDIAPYNRTTGKGPLRRKQEFFIEYLLCKDCLSDIKYRGALIDALGGK